MGWANCGEDSRGRLIGYAHDAVCDHPGCETSIHRGLAHACGGMHGDTEHSCEGYFCSQHLDQNLLVDDRLQPVCTPCYTYWRTYAIEHPEDAEDLVAFFTDWEGLGWNQPTA